MNHSPEYSAEDYLLHGGRLSDFSEPQRPEKNEEGFTDEDLWFLYGEREQHPLKKSLFQKIMVKISSAVKKL